MSVDWPQEDRRFVRRTLFQALTVVVLYLVWQLSAYLLVVFAAVLVAVLLRSISAPLKRHLRLGDEVAVIVAAVLIVATLALGAVLFGTLLIEQLGELADRMPPSPQALRQRLLSLPLGGQLARWIGDSDQWPGFTGAAGRVGAYAVSAAGVLANLLVVAFAGFFLALRPRAARHGLLSLLPRSARRVVGRAIHGSARSLRLWLIGMAADMAAVGVLTGLGAWMLGLPSPLALAVLAALFDFVPIIGPIVSAAPGLLLASSMGLEKTLWTAGMYLAVQQVEGNLLYPLIQKRAVELSPALSILAVGAAAVLFGVAGVILATPLLVVGVSMTKVIYIRHVLGEPRKDVGAAAG